jgi:hypothetical protein
MLDLVNTIVPIFVIILLGGVLRHRGVLSAQLISPLNQLVFYLAIPAMIFRAVAKASFASHFHPFLLAGMLLPVLFVFGLAVAAGRRFPLYGPELGTFLQSSIHGNLGYIGLAVSYYLLGQAGLTRASILAGFLMILQNVLSVAALQACAGAPKGRRGGIFFLRTILGNPVIASAMAGIVFSLLQAPLPVFLDRILEIIGGMALPLALLIIGGSLSFGLIRYRIRITLLTSCLKLAVLPAMGLGCFLWLGLSPEEFLPGFILLAAPTATVTYIMAGEMNGSTELAAATVSLNTLLSAATYLLWLAAVQHLIG